MQIQKVIEQYRNNPFALRWAMKNYLSLRNNEISNVVNDFYSLALKYRTKDRLTRLLQKYL